MNTEEKAKAYDEAIQRAKEILEIGVKDSRDKKVILSFFPELKESDDERTRKELVSHFREMRFVTEEGAERAARWIAWIEKQGKQLKKVSIWKHWKDGIAGNGNGEPVYLIKDCSTYSLSSVLSFECDYIELSELDNLMLEQQGNPTKINPSEFDLRLNRLLKQFETLPKEELADTLSFYLDVVIGEKKSQRNISAEAKEALYGN